MATARRMQIPPAVAGGWNRTSGERHTAADLARELLSFKATADPTAGNYNQFIGVRHESLA